MTNLIINDGTVPEKELTPSGLNRINQKIKIKNRQRVNELNQIHSGLADALMGRLPAKETKAILQRGTEKIPQRKMVSFEGLLLHLGFSPTNIVIFMQVIKPLIDDMNVAYSSYNGKPENKVGETYNLNLNNVTKKAKNETTFF
jgi:hypothetical protein